MAKRKQQADEQAEFDDVEPIPVEEPEPDAVSDIIAAVEEDGVPFTPPEHETFDIPIDVNVPDAVYAPDAASAPTMRVTLELPIPVLYALIDATHPEADVEGADHVYKLMESDTGVVLPMGELVLAGIDQTTLRHKMNAATRNAANAKVDAGI